MVGRVGDSVGVLVGVDEGGGVGIPDGDGVGGRVGDSVGAAEGGGVGIPDGGGVGGGLGAGVGVSSQRNEFHPQTLAESASSTLGHPSYGPVPLAVALVICPPSGMVTLQLWSRVSPGARQVSSNVSKNTLLHA